MSKVWIESSIFIVGLNNFRLYYLGVTLVVYKPKMCYDSHFLIENYFLPFVSSTLSTVTF